MTQELEYSISNVAGIERAELRVEHVQPDEVA